MTRVVRFHQTGGPQVLKIEQADIGEPGPGELRLRIEAIGLNRAEVMFRSGAYLEQPKFPARLGYEASGVVEAVGSGVTGFHTGDAVCVIPAFSLNDYGVYAERAVVPAHAVVRRPAGLSAVEAAAVWMQYITAWGALIDIGRLQEGQAALLTAASSSVGLAAIQIANAVGGVPIATTRTRAKVEALKRAGAAHVIVTGEEELLGRVMQITAGRGAELIFDPIAGPGVETLAQAAAKNATLFIYGMLSGAPTPFPMAPAMLKGLTLRAYTLFEITGDPPRLQRAERFVSDGLASGALKPVIARTFPFDEIVEAHRYMESNQQIGKIVVEMPRREPEP